MRLTTKGRFAVTAMIDLALRQNSGPVTLAAYQPAAADFAVVPRTTASASCAVMNSSSPPGVRAVATTWRRKAADITVADIIVSVDEPIDATQCGGKEELASANTAVAHDPRTLGLAEPAHGRSSSIRSPCKSWSTTRSPRACRSRTSRRSSAPFRAQPVVKPIRVNAPNSVFALGNVFAKS